MSTLQEYRISEIAEVIGGGTPDTKDESLWNGDIAWITPADLSRNKEKYFRIGERSITQKGLKESSTRLLPKGTVLLSSRAPIGYLAIAANSICTNQGFKSLVCYTDIVSNEYLYYYLLLQRDYLETISSGATFPELSGGTLKKLKILLPPLPTQQRIASILSAYDDLIEVNYQRIKLLEETARELYKEWFVRMRFPGYKKAKFVKGVPEGWEVVRLDNVLSFKTGKLNSNASTLDGQYPFFTCSNADFKTDTYSFDTEAVLLAGNNAAGIYPLKYYKGKFDAYQRTYIIKPKSDDISHKYVYYYFLERLEFLQTISIGAATQFLTTQMLKKLLMFLPHKNLMLRFSIIVDPIFEQVQILNQQNTQLRQIRDRLLPRLISGKLEVKEKQKLIQDVKS